MPAPSLAAAPHSRWPRLTFALDHLAYFLLTSRTARPAQVKRAGAGREHLLGCLESKGYIDFDDLQLERGYKPFRAYAMPSSPTSSSPSSWPVAWKAPASPPTACTQVRQERASVPISPAPAAGHQGRPVVCPPPGKGRRDARLSGELARGGGRDAAPTSSTSNPRRRHRRPWTPSWRSACGPQASSSQELVIGSLGPLTRHCLAQRFRSDVGFVSLKRPVRQSGRPHLCRRHASIRSLPP